MSNQLEKDVGVLKEDVKILKEDVKVLNEDVKVLKEEMIEVKEDIRVLKVQVRDIQLTLENVIGPNICRIAEAHLDLSRKLDEALKIRERDEIMFLRLNNLENEIRKMKQAN